MSRGLSSASLGLLREAIEARYALKVAHSRWGDLEKGLAHIADELGLSIDAAAATVALQGRSGTNGASQGGVLLDRLVRHVTIGETYFFRHPDQFKAFETDVLPRIIESRNRDGRKSLSIWSAGCSTGEEVYSLAMSVSRAEKFLHGWQISIVGTDLNADSIQAAERGLYRDWSFRGMDDSLRPLWFDEVSGAYRVKKHLRHWCTFAQLNLADDFIAAPIFPASGVDVIFCRNVLMYFRRDIAVGILSRMRERMPEEGWLVVAPSEASLAHDAGFSAERFPGCTLFAKAHRKKAKKDRITPDKPVASPHAAKREPSPHVATWQAKKESHNVSGVSAIAAARAEARAAADARDFLRAEELVEKMIAHDSTDYRAHLLQAIIAMEMGDDERARTCLTRTLFLEPGSVSALVSMGNLLRRTGRTAEAARHFDAAIRILDSMDPGEIVPDSEGVAAGVFASMTRVLRESGGY